jgi:serine/threonine-protein kinase RsbW
VAGTQIARYANTLSAPGEARVRVVAVLRDTAGMNEEGLEDAALITSELVTNAVHAGCHGLCINLETGTTHIRISVIDDAPGLPMEAAPGDDLESGRGLAIVSALSAAWGVTQREHLKEVWADILRSGVA